MENQDAKNLIVEVLQHVLFGAIKPEFNIKPADVADAIIQKVEFSSSFAENTDKELFVKITNLKAEAEKEYEKLGDQDVNKLLRNFARGKITAFEEILATLKK